MTEQLVGDIKITPAWDRRDPDPKKNYGIHGCELRFTMKGKKGAVSFVAFTDWGPKNAQEESMGKGTDSPVTQVVVGIQPMAVDVGYHSHKPQYKEQSSMKCDVLGGKCYYDGFSSQADKVRDIMLREGSDGVWKYLANYYKEVFGGGK